MDLHAVDGMYQGIRSHVLELFPHVFRLCPELDFFLFLDDARSLVAEHPGFLAENVRAVRMPTTGSTRRLALRLPRLEREHRIDLLHSQYITPLRPQAARVVTLHDLLFLSHPRFFSPLFRLRSSVLMRLSARRAAHVLTVSEFSRGEIVRRLGLPPERVSVASNAVDLTRFRPGSVGRSAVRALGLAPGNYVLSVGRIEPRKDHATLLEAYARLGPRTPPLVIAGAPDRAHAELQRRIDRLGLRRRVRVLDEVGDGALPDLYRHCRLFVYPSRAEGFGMPPLEAMASGVPVVASRSTALTDVIADGGRLVDPGDVRGYAQAMRRLLEHEDERVELAERGLRRARRFHWSRSARVVARVYRRVLAAHRHTD